MSAAFLEKGYVIVDVADRGLLDRMRHQIVELVCDHLNIDRPDDDSRFLDHIHERVAVEDLNDMRFGTYQRMNAIDWWRPSFFALGRSTIEALVGNELAMQNRINLSVQLPEDNSSLLGIHADVFGGETPFQVVQWLPLVDCYRTKSMFLLPRGKNREIMLRMSEFQSGGMAKIHEEVQDDLVQMDVPYGKALIFTPNQLHGGTINHEATTRWSMNARFTGLFTPYTGHEKKLGSFYLPITTKAVSRIGMEYEQPGDFDE